MAERYFAGLDLGQASQFTALAVLARQQSAGPAGYAVRHLRRWQPGTPYHEVAAEVRATLDAGELVGYHLVVDRTGVGRAAAALFEPAAATVHSLVVSAGQAVGCGEDGSLHVPKKELVAVLQVLLQTRRLRIAGRLALADLLAREMQTFRAAITPAGAAADLSWREREHDDLVLAVAVAAWAGERVQADDGEPLVLDGPAMPAWLRW